MAAIEELVGNSENLDNLVITIDCIENSSDSVPNYFLVLFV